MNRAIKIVSGVLVALAVLLALAAWSMSKRAAPAAAARSIIACAGISTRRIIASKSAALSRKCQ